MLDWTLVALVVNWLNKVHDVHMVMCTPWFIEASSYAEVFISAFLYKLPVKNGGSVKIILKSKSYSLHKAVQHDHPQKIGKLDNCTYSIC